MAAPRTRRESDNTTGRATTPLTNRAHFDNHFVAEYIAEEIGCDAELGKQILDVTIEGIIRRMVANGGCYLLGLGGWKVIEQRGGRARVVGTGDLVSYGANRRAMFRTSDPFKRRLNGTTTTLHTRSNSALPPATTTERPKRGRSRSAKTATAASAEVV
jgi:nucleoid DNA-binding protein